jgi:hypothetical protein
VFDNLKHLPKIDNMLIEFMTFLVDKKLKTELKIDSNRQINFNGFSSSTISYIEKLLEIRLSDYRKYSISLILAPYFVNILKLSREESFRRINEWALKCNDVKPLEPSIKDFNIIIENAIKRAKIAGIKPLKFKDTLQYKNKNVYDIILSSLKN